LILRNVIKTVATRCRILKLKFAKFDFGWSSQALLGELTALPQTLKFDLRGPTSKGGREGMGGDLPLRRGAGEG